MQQPDQWAQLELAMQKRAWSGHPAYARLAALQVRCGQTLHALRRILVDQPANFLPGVMLPWQTGGTCLPHAAHISQFASVK